MSLIRFLLALVCLKVVVIIVGTVRGLTFKWVFSQNESNLYPIPAESIEVEGMGHITSRFQQMMLFNENYRPPKYVEPQMVGNHYNSTNTWNRTDSSKFFFKSNASKNKTLPIQLLIYKTRSLRKNCVRSINSEKEFVLPTLEKESSNSSASGSLNPWLRRNRNKRTFEVPSNVVELEEIFQSKFRRKSLLNYRKLINTLGTKLKFRSDEITSIKFSENNQEDMKWNISSLGKMHGSGSPGDAWPNDKNNPKKQIIVFESINTPYAGYCNHFTTKTFEQLSKKENQITYSVDELASPLVKLLTNKTFLSEAKKKRNKLNNSEMENHKSVDIPSTKREEPRRKRSPWKIWKRPDGFRIGNTDFSKIKIQNILSTITTSESANGNDIIRPIGFAFHPEDHIRNFSDIVDFNLNRKTYLTPMIDLTNAGEFKISANFKSRNQKGWNNCLRAETYFKTESTRLKSYSTTERFHLDVDPHNIPASLHFSSIRYSPTIKKRNLKETYPKGTTKQELFPRIENTASKYKEEEYNTLELLRSVNKYWPYVTGGRIRIPDWRGPETEENAIFDNGGYEIEICDLYPEDEQEQITVSHCIMPPSSNVRPQTSSPLVLLLFWFWIYA